MMAQLIHFLSSSAKRRKKLFEFHCGLGAQVERHASIAAWSLPLQHIRDFDQRHPGRVVHRAVVNFITVNRLAYADLIQVRAEYHVFVG